ncbi:MAG: hypothetical protein V7L05_24495 [Nostoc sp.]
MGNLISFLGTRNCFTPCPMTNAQQLMPNAQCPMPNPQQLMIQ